MFTSVKVSESLFSDHSAVHCRLNTIKPPALHVEFSYRKYKDISIPQLTVDITSALHSSTIAEEKMKYYNTTRENEVLL